MKKLARTNRALYRELEIRQKEIKKILSEKAQFHAFRYDIEPAKEAQRIGSCCEIFEKRNSAIDFIDIAMWLLCYPPELALKIAIHFADFDYFLSWNPFDLLMRTVENIDYLSKKILVAIRKTVLNQQPEILGLSIDRRYRNEKAGQLLAVAIIYLSKNLKEARYIFRKSKINYAIKEVVKKELLKLDPEIAQRIIY